LGTLALAGCYAQTEPASDVGSNSATLNAHGFTTGKQGQAFFQYSTAKNALGTGFGLQTPTLTFPPNASGPFTAKVSGLSPGTNYWFRVCGNDVGDQPHCNSDLEFTTVVPGAKVAFAPPLDVAGDGFGPSADFNGDGVADLAVVDLFQSRMRILLGNGDATFRDAGLVDVGGVNFNVLAGDVNRDGKLDLIVTPHSGGVTVFPGRGDGTFGSPIITPTPDYRALSAVRDFNRDGSPDIVVFAQQPPGQAGFKVAQLMIGNGNGTFQPASQTLVAQGGDNSRWSGLAAGDFNRDGKLDMALTKFGCNITPSACGVSAFVANGNGTFGPEHVYAAGSDSPFGLLAGAFHGGANLDLVMGTTAGFTILNGRGDGTFAVGASYFGANNHLSDAADVNGDGRLDLLVVEGFDTHVFLGNGNGTLQSPITITNCGPGATADFNGDGKPDLPCVVTNPNLSSTPAVRLNATPPLG
jgi:hypothetical protein